MKNIKFGWDSLTMRLTVSFAVLLIIVTLAVTTISVFGAKSAMEENLRMSGNLMLSAMESNAGNYLARYDYDLLQKTTEEFAQREPGVSYVIVVNADGLIVAHSDRSQEGKNGSDIAATVNGNSRAVERMTRYKNYPVLELTAPVMTAGMRRGTIRFGLNSEGVNRSLRRLVLTISLASLVLLCLAIFTVRTLTSKVASGLTGLMDKTRKISEGELNIEVPEKGYREVRALAHAFNVMAQNLHSILQQMQDLGSHINTVFSNMLSVIQEQAANASQQATSVTEVTATMEELSRTSRQIAKNAESVKEASSKSVEVAQAGTTLGREGVEAMAQIKDRVGDIARKTLFLGEKSHEIGKVMDIIKEIASEIHLLALNAAIESAAAGEHGRRFGVVASEVRRLAEKTRESTETIRGIIGEIQSATNSSVEATEQGTREVDKWKETIRKASEAFSEIIETIERTSEASTQISLATHQQTSANEQVVQAMRQIEEMVRVTAGHMKELSGSASNLKGMVAKFQEITAVFEL